MALLQWIQETLRCGFLDHAFTFITHLGDVGIVWILLGVVLLCRKTTRRWGWAVLFSLLFAYVIGDLIIKNIVQRPRPFTRAEVELLIPPPDSWSFPSGHSGSSFAAATALFLCSKKWGTPALVLAGLIAFSRMYLFVHYPTDVLCGILLGVLTAFAVCGWMNRKKAKTE